MTRLSLLVLLVSSLSCSLAAHNKPDRDSGQSKLMDDSFAGKNRCNPDDHLRPFVIEWDGTDRASFEQIVGSDVVFVHYEGCSLRVLEQCRNEDLHGELGAYKPTEWASGSLEKLDIENVAELYAKLPLGQASLEGRVQGGETFHMEYFVAGTRISTRNSVYRDELKGRFGCENATHFVSGYNLGAFALASKKNLSASAGGSAFGFGAGASERRNKVAEKQGGKLPMCDSESAKEVLDCQAPIRLTLREIRPGENPDRSAMKRKDTPESLAAAGLLDAKMKMNEKAFAYLESAMRKLGAKDGKGCIDDLDKHDALDAKHKSSDPKSGFGIYRGQCVMLAGKCDAGKAILRRTAEQMPNMQGADGAEIDRFVELQVAEFCRGKLGDRDELLRALGVLQHGVNNTKVGIAGCTSAIETIHALRGKVKPKDGEDWEILNIDRGLPALAAGCFGRNGDCDLALTWMTRSMTKQERGNYDALDEAARRKAFVELVEAFAPRCRKP